MNDAESWEVIKLIQRYPETILQAADKYEPSVIAKHAIKLAQAFNKYYANVKILAEDAQKDARLALVYAVTVLLKEDLRLLGLHAPDKCNKKIPTAAYMLATGIFFDSLENSMGLDIFSQLDGIFICTGNNGYCIKAGERTNFLRHRNFI